jgi:hypothetical protein
MEFMTVKSGNYTDISDFDNSGEMPVMPRGICSAVLPTEQKTPRLLSDAEMKKKIRKVFFR